MEVAAKGSPRKASFALAHFWSAANATHRGDELAPDLQNNALIRVLAICTAQPECFEGKFSALARQNGVGTKNVNGMIMQG